MRPDKGDMQPSRPAHGQRSRFKLYEMYARPLD